MQESSLAAKVRVEIDGVEMPGLVKFGEVSLEKGTIDVPGFKRITKIQSGVTTYPEVPMTYETRRDTETRKFLRKWYDENEQKDMTVIYCDAGGVEYARDIWQSVECKKFSIPEVDFANVSYARVDIILLPYNILPV